MNKEKIHENNNLSFYAIDSLSFLVTNDKCDYENYKKGYTEYMKNNRHLEMDILSLLDSLGYPMEEVGTYLYKNIIMKIINTLKNTKLSNPQDICYDLFMQLKEDYSQFYFDIARNDLDIGLKSFHKYIKIALSKIDYAKANLYLLDKISADLPYNMHYGQCALLICEYILENYEVECDKSPKVRRLFKFNY